MLDSEAELQALHTGNVKESLHLEYKASDAVDKRNDKKKIDMASDVSAFANADGGQIVYGMTESNHEPAGLDARLDQNEYPEIWFEQILQQHVTPKIEGVRPYHVRLSSGRVAGVIDVPATKGDPHQVSDGRYYRRHNFNRLIMEHYEIQAAFRRVSNPELVVTLELARGSNSRIEFGHQQELSRPTRLKVLLGNRTNQLSFYTIVQIGVSEMVGVVNYPGWELIGSRGEGRAAQTWFVLRRSCPPDFPIFKEVDLEIDGMELVFHERLMDGHSIHHFRINVEVQTPGFTASDQWKLTLQGAYLEIEKVTPLP